MTVNIRLSRRLIIIGAAVLAAAAVAMILADMFVVFAGITVLLALTLVFVAVGALDRPRAATAILHVISAMAFPLGIVLVGIATAIVQGPSANAATFIMFLCGAAEFTAAGLVVAAASRLPRPAVSEDTNAWKMRVAPAALLGISWVVLLFLLGQVRMVPAALPAAKYVDMLPHAIIAGGYSLLASYLLLRGLPRANRNLWIILAMNAAPLLLASLVLISEESKLMGLQVTGIAIISIACSYGGLTLEGRATRHHEAA